MENQNELNSQDLKSQNKFNKALNKRFHVSPSNNIHIQGANDSFILTPDIQEEILQCLANIEVNKAFDIEPNFLEKFSLEVLFRDTY